MLATSGNAGWGRDSWSRRSSFAGSRDTNRSQPSSRNWKRWRRLSRGLSNRERRRRVGYAGVATFHGAPGVSIGLAATALTAAYECINHAISGDLAYPRVPGVKHINVAKGIYGYTGRPVEVSERSWAFVSRKASPT